MKRLFFVILLIVTLPVSAYSAAVSANYQQIMQILGPGGGNSSSSGYSGTSAAGGSAVGKSTSTSYINISGALGILAILGGDTIPPVISNLKVDGRTFVSSDNIKKDGTLTATVTDDIGIDQALSSIEVDGVATTFTALTGSSSYDASTGILTYKFNFMADGNHSIAIRAVDTSGNSTTVSRTAKVDTGDLKATSVYTYPNPFKGIGNIFIAYQLNKDSDTSIYIFNAIGQLVYRKNISSGQEGAHTGYNEVAWDGKTDFGEMLSNDIYFLRVVSGGKPVGRTKIAVIK